MSVVKKEVEKYTCDGCGRVHVVEEGDDLPDGYHLEVTHIGAHGGDGGKVFACRPNCIRKAVENYREAEAYRDAPH